MFRLYSVEDIPITKLLHDDKYAYKKEGHGGKPVWEWPIYHFFKLYHSGENEKANRLFIDWYMEQYQKYSNVPKTKGGMKNGSLDKLYLEMQNNKNRKISIRESVVERVRQRFQLLEQIKSVGYRPVDSDPIKVFRLSGYNYKLFGGHHRVAIMSVLGYDIISDIHVYNNKMDYICHNLLKKLTNIFNTYEITLFA